MAKITDKTVKSKYPPKQTNVTWIDTSQKPAVTKSYIDGQWVVVGGGVTDYNDIKNKPTINGVELDGNKTSSDLGVATSQQGTKADTAYQKPSSGIPESDLSSDVQSQLNKHFKGWFASVGYLETEYPSPVIGDYAYVKGAESTDPAAIYECTTDGTWSDSGRTADTSNVQTFASSQEVNEVHIVNDLITGGSDDVLSAEQGKELNIMSIDDNICQEYEDTLSSAIPRYTDRTIISNQYTNSYICYLVLLKPGTYKLVCNYSIPNYIIAGYLDSIDDFVIGGVLSDIVLKGSSNVGDEVVFSVSENKYLVVLGNDSNGFGAYATLYNRTINTTKGVLQDVASKVSDLMPVIRYDKTTQFQLADDLDFFTTSSYGLTKIGQYTKLLSQDTKFTSIRINQLSCNIGSNITYKVYITNAGVRNLKRECPVGVIGNNSSTYILVKSGSFIVEESGFNDYEITLDKPYTCPKNYQVVVYLVSDNTINIRGASNGIGNDEKTSNASLYCTGNDPFGQSSWAAGSVNETTNYGYYNVALTLLLQTPFVTRTELDNNITQTLQHTLPQLVNNEFDVDLDIIIPDVVYSIVGTQLNIWNDTITLSIDKGLYSPTNYQVRWSCSKGFITDRCFRFTPTSSDVGDVSCTCYIYDSRGVFVRSKTFTIKVLAKDVLDSSKNIVYFGDSLGGGCATALYDNFHDSNRFSGTAPNMLGTKGTTKHYEAVGGYKWYYYATAGADGFRISVSNVNSIEIGSVYSDGSHNFEIYEVNITEGSGNVLLGKHYTNMGTLIMPSGTLTKVSGSGDNTIPYTDAYQESVNPLWNDSTQQLDINQYKQMLVNLGQLSSISDKIDAVSFQLGVNECLGTTDIGNSLNDIKTYITDLYNLFVDDNPDCKFIIGLTTSSGNDVNGCGMNYGAARNNIGYLKNVYIFKKFYISLLEDDGFSNLRIATPNLLLDRYYGYGFSTRMISDRYQVEEQYHSNYVHPETSGYNQMADAYLACYVGVLTE